MLDKKNDLINVARTTKTLIRVLAFLMVGIYGWLQLENVPIGQTLGSISAEIFFRSALIIYFVSWVAGSINDTNDQEIVYTTAPSKGKLPIKAYILVIVIATVFGILCMVQSIQQFSILLFVFLAINIISWLYLTREYLPEIIEKSEKNYKSNKMIDKLLSLDIYHYYQFGEWQKWRFLFGGILVFTIIILSFSSLPNILSQWYSFIPAETYQSLAVLFYVILFESWIWIMRIKNKISRQTVGFVVERIAV